MNLWSIFITGLFAGGASCAAVQGGLLVASVTRRNGQQPLETVPPVGSRPARVAHGTDSKSRERLRRQQRARLQRIAMERQLVAPPQPREPMSVDDAVPVAGFLGGKLASRTLLGALLGLFGASFQLGFRARAILQFVAGALMLLMAANLLGVPGLAFLVPSPPARLTRLVRRTARSEAVFAPVLLGFRRS